MGTSFALTFDVWRVQVEVCQNLFDQLRLCHPIGVSVLFDVNTQKIANIALDGDIKLYVSDELNCMFYVCLVWARNDTVVSV